MTTKTESLTVRSYRTVQEALAEVEREINIRSRCFPMWIEQGKVNRIDAQDRLDRLATALLVLEFAAKADGLEEQIDSYLTGKNGPAPTKDAKQGKVKTET